MKIILSSPTKEQEKLINLYSRGYTSLIYPGEWYSVKLVNDDDCIYEFPEAMCYDGELFWVGQEELLEKLKEYDNPKTEIIFDNYRYGQDI